MIVILILLPSHPEQLQLSLNSAIVPIAVLWFQFYGFVFISTDNKLFTFNEDFSIFALLGNFPKIFDWAGQRQIVQSVVLKFIRFFAMLNAYKPHSHILVAYLQKVLWRLTLLPSRIL